MTVHGDDELGGLNTVRRLGEVLRIGGYGFHIYDDGGAPRINANRLAQPNPLKESPDSNPAIRGRQIRSAAWLQQFWRFERRRDSSLAKLK
jgi:hypothetical protein